MACIAPGKCMDDGQTEYQTVETAGGETLRCLAEQLQSYKPPGVVLNGDTENGDHVRSSNLEINKSIALRNTELLRIDSKEKRAAVLICLFEGHEGELRVILTKRSMKLSSHPGEVVLPGGKMDEGDVDDSATALREAMEEIGLDQSLVQVVANLEPFISWHLLKVVPVVGLLSRVGEFKPLLNADEVDALFDVPLEMFLKEDSHRYIEKEWGGWKYICHVFDFESEQGIFVIGGLTASILIRAASVIFKCSPSFSEHLPDFSQLQLTLNSAA